MLTTSQYLLLYYIYNTNDHVPFESVSQCNDHFLIIVAKKLVDVIAKWINLCDLLITWSPPVNNNPLINGYEVFYGVCDCNCTSKKHVP